MEARNRFSTFSATGATATIFGALAGLGGLNHGIGETLQGNVASGGIIVNSWTVGPIATNMGGEPAMTLAPSLLVAGILTIIVSLALTVWSVAFVYRKNGGLVQLLLSIAMLLVGGGFAPPVVAILASIAGLKIHSSYGWWRAHLSVAGRRSLARLWPWLFAVCVINSVFLTVGSVVLVYLIGLNAPNLFVISFLFAVVSLSLTIVIGFSYDIEKGLSPQPAL